MKRIIDIITTEVKAAFTACGYDESFAKVTLSNRPDLCEYQCNGAMAAAKTYKTKPIEIANAVVAALSGNCMFEAADAVMPGFINLKLGSEFLASYINEMRTSEKHGMEEVQKKETVIVDYGGANVAKPLHVGHLRAAVIGEAIKRMGRFVGHQVIGDVHLGDWGLQMGLIIEELRDRQPQLPYFDEAFTGEYPSEPPFTISELEEIYPTASAKSKADEAFRERAQDATLRLQKGYAPYRAIWQHIMKVSVADLKKNYSSLQVEFDLWKGESDAEQYIPDMIQGLIDKGLAYESQGALVVDIAEETDSRELPPCIIRKSDGAALYATSDLATIVEREQDFHPDHYVYVVDKRQELHFTQVFRTAKKAGITAVDRRLDFVGFGTMNGKDGKPFKTREGGIMRLENLIAEINEAAYERIMENRTVSEEEARETAKLVGLAALKYGDLSNQATKDYVFDIERFTSFSGNTGPYVLYMITRVNSIRRKYEALCGEQGIAVRDYSVVQPPASEPEKTLMLSLARFSEAIQGSFEELAPHKLCAYIYELATALSHFYDTIKILAEEDKERQAGYISLVTLTRDVLRTCIHVLGFEAPERM